MADQMDALQTMFVQSDVSRALVDERLGRLADAVERLSQRLEQDAGATLVLERIAEGQDRVISALQSMAMPVAEAETGGVDAESRMRLRSIDVQLLRILEEISAGRSESIAELRGDLAALTVAIRQMSRGAAVAARRE